jgi:Cu(I)/Ag(I) efflux system protein CusF
MKTKSSIAIVCAAALMVSATTVFADSATADGEVKKIDAAAGKISIRHGPVKKFDMEDPMTMIYRVKDPSILKTVKVGDKVKFDADRENGVFTVTKIEKAK